MQQVTVLAVTSRAADVDRLHRLFANSNWQLQTVGSIADAVQHVAEFQTPIVLCADTIEGESWNVVFKWMRATNPEVEVVVISRSMDDAGWGEALSAGAFDVLPVPLEASEVLRVVAAAWRHWRDTNARRAAVGPLTEQAQTQATGQL
jgi:DNA-binding NtrC family response regulator